MLFKAHLSFENVGQGLFYRGNVLLDSKNIFSFVYDCGSLSNTKYISESVKAARSYNKSTLDLLIVSHLDEDHVNFIAELIKNIRVRKLVLPYLSWIERLEVFLKSKSTDNEYIEMLTDPIAFFSRDNFSIDEIIVVGGPDDSPFTNNNIRPTLPSIDSEFRSEIEIIAYGTKVQMNKIDAYYFNFSSVPRTKSTATFYKTPFAILIQPFWEFQFYLLERLDKSKINEFENDVKKFMKLKKIVNWADLFDRKHRETLRKKYRKYYSNVNQTSLIVYHGCTKPVLEKLIYSCRFYYGWHLLTSDRYGTLLTGDFKMSSHRLLDDISSYFTDYWEGIQIFMVPHHGAKANWNFNHPNDLERFEGYIVSSGIGRKHHPSLNVLEDINENCYGFYFLSNELDRYSYSYYFES